MVDNTDYNRNLYDRVVYYIETNNITLNTDEFKLTNDGLPNSESKIENWTVNLPQPTCEMLEALDLTEVDKKSKRRTALVELKKNKLPTITTNQQTNLLSKMSNGMIWFNTTTKKITYFVDNAVIEL